MKELLAREICKSLPPLHWHLNSNFGEKSQNKKFQEDRIEEFLDFEFVGVFY